MNTFPGNNLSTLYALFQLILSATSEVYFIIIPNLQMIKLRIRLSSLLKVTQAVKWQDLDSNLGFPAALKIKITLWKFTFTLSNQG